MVFIFSGLANLIVSRPGLVSKVFLAVMVISLVGMTMLSMQTGNSTYIDMESPRGMLLDHYLGIYQKDSVIFIIESEDSTSYPVLHYLDTIEPALQNLQYVDSVTSIVDVIKPLNNGVLPSSSEEIARLQEQIPDSIKNRLVPSHMMTLAQVTLEPGLSEERNKFALANIRSFIDSTNIPPGVTIDITGESAFQDEMQEEMSKSMGILIAAALILMIFVLGILFSYVNHRFLPIVIVAIGLILTFGFMGLTGIRISMTVIAAFPVLLGLGVDYAIQIQSRLEEEARDHPLPEAIITTITKTGPAVMYAMLATSVGFAAMYISPVPMIWGFGLVSIIGVMFCYISSLVGIPLFAVLTNYKARGHGRSKMADVIDNGLSRSAVWIARRPVPILLVVIFIAFIGIQVDPLVPVSTNENTFVPSDMPAKVTMEKVTRVLGSTSTIPLLIAGSDVLSIDTMRWIEQFTDFEKKSEPKIIDTASIVDYILLYNNGTMPQTRYELDQVLSRIPAEQKDQFVYGRTETVIQISTVDMETEVMQGLRHQIEGDLAFLSPPPGITVSLTGTFELFTRLIEEIVESKEMMTYLGFLFVVVFLIIVYRNINAVSPIVPIVAIVGWNGVVLYLFGIDYNPLTACLGSMTIGVAAEYTILVMERYLEEKEKTPNTILAIKNSVRKIGSAILVSGLATFFGFSALLFATFPIISNFGLSTIIVVGFSLTGAIVVMPAILSFLDQIIHGVEEIDEKVFHHSHPPRE
ncbi:MAG: RND family transporter [Methanospirillaceae archaeon]|nr:RND family transporter [Methanospirillaceae archaeon]